MLPVAALAALGTLLDAAGCGDPGASPPVDTCATGNSRASIITQLAFAREGPTGVSPGFDLDHRVSTATDDVSCHHPDFTSPEGVPGVDNQLALLVPVLAAQTQGAIDGLLQGAINNGQLLISVELQHVDDLREDGCVGVVIRSAQGTPTVGSDGYLNPNQTFDTPANSPLSQVSGTIHGGVVRAGPFELALPIAVLDARTILHLHGAMVQLTLAADGSMQGVIGGGLSVDDIASFSQGLNIPSALMAVVANVVHSIADLDHTDSGCQQFSGAITVSSRPAFLNP